MANTRAKTAAARDRDARSSTRDDREYVDELTHVSPSEAYGFAGMILTTVAFIAWLFAIFASEETLEAYGAPSGATTQHYARVLPMWVFAALLYAFLGYECLNLMSTPDDMDVRFAGVVPDPSEYIVSDAEVAAGMKNMVGKQTDIPLFRDILAREATAKIFNERIREELIAQCAASVSE